MGWDRRAVNWSAWTRAREFRAPQLQTALEYAAIALVAGAAIGLTWAALAPGGRDGSRPSAPAYFNASPSTFAAFDPFFRLDPAAGRPGIVTSLNLTLHGVRTDNVSGRGSAIIGLPDGVQNSYAVGDEIVPGAVLAAVAFDSVVIGRDGARETLYLDQSTVAPVAAVPGEGVQSDPFAAIRAGGAQAAPPPLISDISAEPRRRGGRIDGYILMPGSIGSAFAAAGFLPGDVLMTIDGRSIGNGAGLEQLAGVGRPVAVEVERSGALIRLIVGNAR